MEGMVLGPVTAKLTAAALATGRTPPELVPFDPLRRPRRRRPSRSTGRVGVR